VPLDPFMRVLVVDDFPAMRKLMRNVLRELGLTNVCEATNGEEALKLVDSEPINLILCDWNMPVMSGLELLVLVRSREQFKDLPFIMVTAESDKMNVVEAIRQKVSNYIIKPFTVEIMEAKLRQVFR
jgi:two-component system, chemotaxis family, chemotaxis protein CheY